MGEFYDADNILYLLTKQEYDELPEGTAMESLRGQHFKKGDYSVPVNRGSIGLVHQEIDLNAVDDQGLMTVGVTGDHPLRLAALKVAEGKR